MKYIPDKSGRFDKRPHYDPSEIDEICEGLIIPFITERCGGFSLPISTDILTKIVERDSSDLDLYADLDSSDYVGDGVTIFIIGEKPIVQISSRLTINKWAENRLRTTIAHEYGHIILHNNLFQPDSPCKCIRPPSDWNSLSRGNSLYDWMEWQAFYFSGALLMPRSYMIQSVEKYCKNYGLTDKSKIIYGHRDALVNMICKDYKVSKEASEKRLIQLSLLTQVKSGVK